MRSRLRSAGGSGEGPPAPPGAPRGPAVPLRCVGPSGRETTRRGHAAPPAAAAGQRHPLLPSRPGAARSPARPLTCAADFHSWSWVQPLGAAGSAAELSWARPGPRSGCAERRRRLPAPFRPQPGASSRPLPSPQAAAAAAAPPRAEVAWPPRSPDSRCRPPAEPQAAGSPAPARRTVRPSGEGRCFRGGREEAGPEVCEGPRGESARRRGEVAGQRRCGRERRRERLREGKRGARGERSAAAAGSGSNSTPCLHCSVPDVPRGSRSRVTMTFWICSRRPNE